MKDNVTHSERRKIRNARKGVADLLFIAVMNKKCN